MKYRWTSARRLLFKEIMAKAIDKWQQLLTATGVQLSLRAKKFLKSRTEKIY